MSRPRRGLGPGLIVAAAFIGPGTVTTATLSGAAFGVDLLWCLLFATAATAVLQEMSARLALVSGRGLAENLAALPGGRVLAWLAAVAVVSGAAAYEAGNLTGTGLGLAAISGTSANPWIVAAVIVSAVLLGSGRYRLLERALMVGVAIMGVLFLITAALVAPPLSEIVRGLVLPALPGGAGVLALALIGTTIVPYNLFLHAAAVGERFAGSDALGAVRLDAFAAITLGGVISAAIVVTAAATLGGAPVDTVTGMAAQLEPLLGDWANLALGLGYAMAGMTSAITAPLAAAYVVLGLTGRPRELSSGTARLVWGGCVLAGGAASLSGFEPVPLIVLAQTLNGLILPLVALALLAVMNRRDSLGAHVNGWAGNLAGAAVVLVCTVIGIRSVVGAW